MSETESVEWTTIKLPKKVHEELKQMAQKRGVPMWKMLIEMMAWYKTVNVGGVSGPKLTSKIPLLDKVSWYIVKLSYAMAKFKDQPSYENYRWVTQVTTEIRQRLKIDLAYLEQTVQHFYGRYNALRAVTDSEDEFEEQIKGDVIELSMAWKMAIIDLIVKSLEEKS